MSETLTEKVNALNKDYLEKFWELRKNKDGFPDEATYKLMCESLKIQYERDYGLLCGEEGIEIDKRIEELKIKRANELREIEMRHSKLTAEIERERNKQNKENALALTIANAEYEMKLEEVVPGDLRRRWWQRRARPNYAKILASKEVQIDVENYFAAREQDIAELEGSTLDIEAVLRARVPCPRGRRARKRWEQEIKAAAIAIEGRLRHCDEEQDDTQEEANTATATAVEESQAEEQEQQQKPKRKRRKRAPAEQQEGESEGEQVPGQLSIEETIGNTEQNADEDKPGQGAE